MLARVTVAEAAQAASEATDKIRLEFISPFVEGAARVLMQECGETVTKGKIHRVRSPQTTSEVSAMIAITGSLAGLVIYSMSRPTACAFASKMIGEPVAEFDEMSQSAIAELANIITGQASIGLERNGYVTDMSPPVLLLGNGNTICTFNLMRIIVPLIVSVGEIAVDIALKEI